MSLYLMQSGKIAMQNGKPVDITQAQFIACCCPEWISYNFTQEGFYDCSRDGAKFSYSDPSAFCGSPFDFTKTNNNLVIKLNYEASTFCGGTLQPSTIGEYNYEKGRVVISMYVTSPMTITITPSSYYNDCDVGIDGNSIISGRGDNFFNQMPWVAVQSAGGGSSKQLMSVPDTTQTHNSCSYLSTDLYWENETNANPWQFTLQAGEYSLEFYCIANWYNSTNAYSIISNGEWDMFGIAFSRDIPDEVV